MAQAQNVIAVLDRRIRMIRVPEPILAYEEFAAGPPMRDESQHLNDQHKRYILWQVSMKTGRDRLALQLGCQRKQVSKVVQEAKGDSRYLLSVRVVVKIAPGYRQKFPRWACVIDGQQFTDPARASRWAWSLIFNDQHEYEGAPEI